MNHNLTQIPVHEVHRAMYNTTGGMVISLTDPAPHSINIEDIAHALSHICRFGGHSSAFYSVAQHCVLVAQMVPPAAKKWGLLHDAPEAYLGDVIKPLKILLGTTYHTLEKNFQTAILSHFNLFVSEETLQSVKNADRLILEIEHEALQLQKPRRLVELMQDDYKTERWAWEPVQAKHIFLETFKNLFECKS